MGAGAYLHVSCNVYIHVFITTKESTVCTSLCDLQVALRWFQGALQYASVTVDCEYVQGVYHNAE